MKKVRKRFWLIFGLGAIGLLALGFLYLFIDEPPPKDDDLRPTRVEVPEAENGFLVVNFGQGEIFQGQEREKYQPFETGWDSKAAEVVVKKNAEILKRFDRSFEFPKFQVPEIKSADERISYAPAWRQLTMVATMRLGVYFEQGNEKEAFEEAMKVIKFWHRISESGVVPITFFMGLAMQNNGIENLTRLLARTKLPLGEIRPFFEEMECLRPSRGVLVEVVKRNYHLNAIYLDAFLRGKLEFFPIPEVMKKLSRGWFICWL